MIKKTFIIFLCMCMLLGGCFYKSSSDTEKELAVYRLASPKENGGTLLVREEISANGLGEVEAIFAALNSKPGRDDMSRVFPDGVRACGYVMENGLATVQMSEEFGALGEMQKFLCACALNLSLCELDGVCAVSVVCGENVFFEQLRPEQLLQADELFESCRRTVKLFLPSEEGKGLAPFSMCFETDGSEDLETLVAAAVLDRLPSYTESTEVLGVEISDGVCRLDLSEAFYGNEPAEPLAGMLVIYSLVDSLCRLNNVESVSITVEGQTVASYGGFRAVWPLAPRYDIIIY